MWPSPPRRVSPGRHVSPGRVHIASALPHRRISSTTDEPRLAHRMGARRMRRFLNDNFVDSVVHMGEAEEVDAGALSTQLPFYQPGFHFPMWLAEAAERPEYTPPRRRPAPAAAATQEPSAARGGRSLGAPVGSLAAAMLARLSKADRALLRASLLDAHPHVLDAEAKLRRFLQACVCPEPAPTASSDADGPAAVAIAEATGAAGAAAPAGSATSAEPSWEWIDRAEVGGTPAVGALSALDGAARAMAVHSARSEGEADDWEHVAVPCLDAGAECAGHVVTTAGVMALASPPSSPLPPPSPLPPSAVAAAVDEAPPEGSAPGAVALSVASAAVALGTASGDGDATASALTAREMAREMGRRRRRSSAARAAYRQGWTAAAAGAAVRQSEGAETASARRMPPVCCLGAAESAPVRAVQRAAARFYRLSPRHVQGSGIVVAPPPAGAPSGAIRAAAAVSLVAALGGRGGTALATESADGAAACERATHPGGSRRRLDVTLT